MEIKTMLDKFKIDSHKLFYHIPRLQQWLQGDNIYPIYMEIGLYRGCNHRCIFCAFDFLEYKPDILNTEKLKKFIRQAKALGVKAILYSGEGEPLLHPDAAKIINFTKQAGIDVAVASNGIRLTEAVAKRIIPALSWLKISLNAGTKLTYAKLHRTKAGDFDLVLDNLKKVVFIRDKYHYPCVIGAQSVLLPDNYHEMEKLAGKLRALRLDYLVVKPYSQHSFSQCKLKVNFSEKDLLSLQKKLNTYSREKFRVIFRINAMNKIKKEKPYANCLGFPFVSHLAATGDLYPCTVFIGQKDYRMGSIYTNSFQRIWESNQRQRVLKKIYTGWDIQKCRQSCRIDEINRYLWELKHPVQHINFI